MGPAHKIAALGLCGASQVKSVQLSAFMPFGHIKNATFREGIEAHSFASHERGTLKFEAMTKNNLPSGLCPPRLRVYQP